MGARAGSAEALRTKSIGAAPPINITANLAKPAFPPPHGPFNLPLNGDQTAARLSCKFGSPKTLLHIFSKTPTASLLRAELALRVTLTPHTITC